MHRLALCLGARAGAPWTSAVQEPPIASSTYYLTVRSLACNALNPKQPYGIINRKPEGSTIEGRCFPQDLLLGTVCVCGGDR